MKRRPDYLSDPAFSESPNGPRVPNGWGSEAGDRDPSPEQIAAMAAAIRAAWNGRKRKSKHGNSRELNVI